MKFVGVFLVVFLFVFNSPKAESVDWTDADSDGDGVPDTGWLQLGENIDGESAGDESGFSVSISSDGSVVAIGARGNDGNGLSAGHARVYSWDGSSWLQRGEDIDGEASEDSSGIVSLSSDGSAVAIGARGNDERGPGSDAGHVRVYSWDGSSWLQRGEDIDGEASEDFSGILSLSSDGSVVAIGAPFNKGFGRRSGHVRVYKWDGSSWLQRGEDIDGEEAGGVSGASVSLSADGNVVAIGAPNNNAGGRDDYWAAGQVRIHDWTGFNWIQRGQDIEGKGRDNSLGSTVSLSSDGKSVAISAARPKEGSEIESANVQIFDWDASAWIWEQRGNSIECEEGSSSLSLSSNADRIAIGSATNDDNGVWAGHVRFFVWNGDLWAPRGTSIVGEAELDQSGVSISLSSGSDTIAIGAPGNDGSGSNAGHVRVFRTGFIDAFPLDPTEQKDSDGDGIGDSTDAFPVDASESVDTDGDGLGNNTDLDDDNDNFTDEQEAIDGTNPLSPFSCRSGCFSFDVDQSSSLNALTDGLLVMRHLFDFSGDTLVANAMDNSATRSSASDISSYLTAAETELDIDGNGEVGALTDGLLLIRYLFDFRGESLISNAVDASATRKTAAEIEAYIEVRLPGS